MPALCFYVDESWDDKKFCLTAICLKYSNWHACLKLIQEHKKNLKKDHGMLYRREFHATDLVSGRGRISDKFISKHARSRIFYGLLELLARMPGVMLFNVCLDQIGKKDAEALAWDRLLNRIERTLTEFETKEIPLRKRLLSLIPENLLGDKFSRLERRLLAYHARALIFADEGKAIEIRRIYRKMTVFNFIPSKHGKWSVGQLSKNIPLENIVEDPIFLKSHESLFIQLADCAAFALLKREVPPTETVKKYKINEFFDECLSGICYKPACQFDPLGIVRK